MGFFLKLRLLPRDHGQGPVCSAVKWSSNENVGQSFLTPVAAVSTAPMGVTTPCLVHAVRVVDKK